MITKWQMQKRDDSSIKMLFYAVAAVAWWGVLTFLTLLALMVWGGCALVTRGDEGDYHE